MTPFEADLDPQTGSPRIRLNFDNGWAVSIVLRMPDSTATRFCLASVAACPTGNWGTGKTEILHNEAYPNEVASFLADISARPTIALEAGIPK